LLRMTAVGSRATVTREKRGGKREIVTGKNGGKKTRKKKKKTKDLKPVLGKGQSLSTGREKKGNVLHSRAQKRRKNGKGWKIGKRNPAIL